MSGTWCMLIQWFIWTHLDDDEKEEEESIDDSSTALTWINIAAKTVKKNPLKHPLKHLYIEPSSIHSKQWINEWWIDLIVIRKRKRKSYYDPKVNNMHIVGYENRRRKIVCSITEKFSNIYHQHQHLSSFSRRW